MSVLSREDYSCMIIIGGFLFWMGVLLGVLWALVHYTKPYWHHIIKF